ncbi:uncharacterized protein PADG_12064 [Paracoccidioides brasiliensis Pb18]|uniref:Altered inheritance of mitochondria protein 32 n=1 Tax=Paracoccidioides brasiliensis (strain Pb18) TaxID=502780 RepID=A0A0A0HU02_PARBD|nr:uncharacterized protein PADG_12064 [Paracoccidioides brasiliensis Pb18]KGM91758.1 hypothetical protein PADG_12064 [Paracoccidioides brasiliensis Pb18]
MPPRSNFSHTILRTVHVHESAKTFPFPFPFTTTHYPQLRQHRSARNSFPSRRINIPPPFPVIPSCPEPTCPCAPMPVMPEGLEIDHAQNLNGTMAPYAQQLLISTGRVNWRSRIDEDGEEEGWGVLVRGLKGLLGRGGKYCDPYNNIMMTNSSFQPARSQTNTAQASALLFPSFRYFPAIPLDPSSLETFTRAYLLPASLHPAHNVLSESQKTLLRRDPSLQPSFTPNMTQIHHSPTVLICGHGHRDQRCGIVGPLLQAEFRRVLRAEGFVVVGGGGGGDDGGACGDGEGHGSGSGEFVDAIGRANVGLISHIGGHKFAGNVIIYLPPSATVEGGSQEEDGGVMSLAGKGIWYGRVEPRHVEGIVEETVLRGRVIAEHFRNALFFTAPSGDIGSSQDPFGRWMPYMRPHDSHASLRGYTQYAACNSLGRKILATNSLKMRNEHPWMPQSNYPGLSKDVADDGLAACSHGVCFFRNSQLVGLTP